MPIGYNPFFNPNGPLRGVMPTNPTWRTLQRQALPFSTGSAGLDFLGMMALGNNIGARPMPGTTQGLADAALMNQRSIEQMMARGNALATMPMFARMGGINQQSMPFQLMNAFAGDPNGPIARFMAPLVGINPMKAQMGMMANMNGQAMSTFGRAGSITLPETSRMMESVYRFGYNYAPMTGDGLKSGRKQIEALIKAKGIGGMDRMFDDNDRINTAQFDKVKSESNRAIKRLGELEEAKSPAQKQAVVNAIVEGYSDEKTQTAIRKAFEKGGEGAVAAVGKVVRDRAGFLNGAVGNHIIDQNNVGKSLPSGLNYRNTMGIQLDEFTSAFTTAATHKLFNKSGSLDSFLGIAKGQTGQSKTGGMLDSLKGLFGNHLSGKELMESFSDILGAGHVDLGNQQSVGAVEQTARNFKMVARNADIAMEAALGLVRSVNDAAAHNEGIHYMGGLQSMDLVGKSIEQAQVMSMTASNAYVRRNGGTIGMINQQVSANMENQAQPIVKQVAAMWHLADQSGNERAKQLIENYRTGASGLGFNASGFGALAGQFAHASGMTTAEVLQFSQNSTAQALGGAKNTKLGEIGEAAVMNRFVQMTNRTAWSHGRGKNYAQGLIARINANMGENGEIDLDKLLTDPVISQNPQFLKFVTENKTSIGNSIARSNKGYGAKQADLARRKSADLAFEKELNANFGGLNAPAAQSIMNQMFTTGVADQSFENLIKPLMGPGKDYDAVKAMSNKAVGIYGATDFAGLQELAKRGGGVNAKDMDDLAAIGKNATLKRLGVGGGGERTLLEKLALMSDEEKKEWAKDKGSGAEALARDAGDTLKNMNRLGLGGVQNFSDFKAVQAGLGHATETEAKELIASSRIRNVDAQWTKDMAKGLPNEKGGLLELSGGQVLTAEKILSSSYDARADSDKTLAGKRLKFAESLGGSKQGQVGDVLKGADGKDLVVDGVVQTRKKIEDAEEYIARAKKENEKKVAKLEQHTSQHVKHAHSIRNAVGLDKPEVKASQDLTSVITKLLDMIKELPGALAGLGNKIEEATKAS